MNVGGPALQVVALQRGLDRDRFESRLLVGVPDVGEADYLELRAPDVSATTVAGLGRSVRMLDDGRAFFAIVREMRRFRPTIVHTHTAKAGVLGRLAAFLTGVPFVVHTFHGHLLHGYFGPTTTRAVIAVERLLARRTDVIVAVGARVRDDLIAAGIGRRDKYRVVPPGVREPTASTREVARAALGLAPSVVAVCFVARLTDIKRPERAIELARRLRARHPELVLLVAGEGPLLPALQADALPLGDTVRFLGWVSEVHELYAAADIVLLTSDNEGMPVSLIEAAMAGRPAVTTDVGSAAEVVEHGVSGFVADDIDALERALEALIADGDLRDRMGRAALERGRAMFGERRLVDDVAAIYDELVRDS